MNKKYLLLALVVWGVARAGALRQELVSRLPAKLRRVEPGVSTRAQIEAILGSPIESDKAASYYSLAGFRYDTVVEFEGDVVRRIVFRPYRRPFALAELESQLRGEPRVALPLEGPESPHVRHQARYFEVPSERVRLRYLKGRRPVVFWYEILP